MSGRKLNLASLNLALERAATSRLARGLMRGRTVWASCLLGGLTGLLYRDERHMPTFIQVKQSYFVHCNRLLKSPDSDVLLIVDPTQVMKVFAEH